MTRLADRMKSVKPSPTLAITAKANELKAQGKNIVGFGAGEPDFDTPENIKQAGIKAIQSGKTKYTPVPGINELKDAVLNKLKRENNLDYTRSEVIVSNGGKHSLFNIAMALVNPGDEVVIPAPYWVSYPDQIEVLGGKPVILQTTDKTDFKITPDQLEKAITAKTKYVIINSPSNPTGSGYSRDELKALADICLKKSTLIVSDEIYEHVVYDGFKTISIAALSPEIKNITITVNGASKCYSMTGWRMGFAVGPKDIVEAMSNLQGHSTSNICSITQWACVEAYNGSQEMLPVMLSAFKERRDYIVRELNSIAGVSCYNPVGAFYVFPNISGLLGQKTPSGKLIKSSDDFCMHLLEDHLVAAVQGEAFGAPGYMRLSYATDLNTIKDGVARIKKAASELK